MELTSNNSTLNFNAQANDIVLVDISSVYSGLMRVMNLLPAEGIYPDDDVLIGIALEASRSQFAFSPHVIKAKCEDIFKIADASLRNEIFTYLFAVSTLFVETFNKNQLWSNAGYAMYEFDSFLNQDTVAIRKTNRIN